MRHAVAAAVLFVTAACNGPPGNQPDALPAPRLTGDMFGTDAHLAPSKPDAVLRYAV